MPSSTFSSDSRARKAFWALIGSLVVFGAALEVSARAVVPKVSQQVRRFQTDRAHAVAIDSRLAKPRKAVLLIGNSLLLDGIDRRLLSVRLGSSYDIVVFPLENTTYLDWYFGMRRLFREGARPDAVVLCMNGRQIASNATSGDFFAHFHMDLADLGAVSALGGLDNMTTSSYLLANQSFWLATKSNVRNGVFERAVPGANSLAQRLAEGNSPSGPAPEVSVDKIVSRLEDLRLLAAQYGSDFAWLVPPTLSTERVGSRLEEASRSKGIRVLVPLSPGSLSSSEFSDGFHLNRLGANKFTEAAAADLRHEFEP